MISVRFRKNVLKTTLERGGKAYVLKLIVSSFKMGYRGGYVVSLNTTRYKAQP